MIAELAGELVQATLAGSAAILVLQALRRPLRRRLGARAAYHAWLLVPMTIAAVWIPAARLPVGPTTATTAVQLQSWSAAALANPSDDSAGALVAAWAIGVLLSVLAFALRQRRFNRMVERRRDENFDTVAGHGPAVVGWWRSRIVLPGDFRERYSRGEQRLVLVHEIAHVRRGDIHAQAFATAMRCVFWFNPLVHFAAGVFRFDQELACDATVLEKFPRQRRRYAEAMLKTQLAGFGVPVGCHWQSSHPLKERIAMLKHALPARSTKLIGSISLALLMTAGTYAAWAAQPAVPTASAEIGKVPAPYLTRITSADSLPPPAYPKGAGQVSGKVVLELRVGVDSVVKEVKVISSEPAGVFDRATIDAASKWVISPAMKDGKPVEGWVRVPVEFRPDSKEPQPVPVSAERMGA